MTPHTLRHMIPIPIPIVLVLVLGLLLGLLQQEVQAAVQELHSHSQHQHSSSRLSFDAAAGPLVVTSAASRRLSRMKIRPDDAIAPATSIFQAVAPGIANHDVTELLLADETVEGLLYDERHRFTAAESALEREQVVLPLLSLPHYCDDFASTKGDSSVATTTIRTNLRSTGTTIAGLTLQDGTVILGADTRATDDRMVADKHCSKIHVLVDRQVYACGAGTSGDLEALTRQVRFALQLQQLHQESIGNNNNGNNNNVNNVDDARNDVDASLTLQVLSLLKNRLYEAAGSLGANLIIGSRADGSLIALHPHGSMERVPYAALGSGGLAAMGVLEDGYSPTLTLQKAKKLLMAAIQAGIDNDLGSGSQVDLCVLHSKEGGKETEYIRAAAPAEDLTVKKRAMASSSESSGGVNGFGNLAYEEQSRRTIMLPDDIGGDDVSAEWDAILGL